MVEAENKHFKIETHSYVSRNDTAGIYWGGGKKKTTEITIS